MTTQIDSKDINLRDLQEVVQPIREVEWATWGTNDLVGNRKYYGSEKRWLLSCWEKKVTWTNSVAKYCQDKIGEQVHLVISISVGGTVLHNVDTYAYVKNVVVTYAGGTTELREFTVDLVEA